MNRQKEARTETGNRNITHLFYHSKSTEGNYE